MKNKIIPYNPRLKEYAAELRRAGNLSEVLLWNEIKSKSLGVEFHRQVPIDNYIVDFYCHELLLAIEVDGGIHDVGVIEEHDIKRQKRLESFGVRFIRFTNKDVKYNIDLVLLTLKNKIVELKGSE